MQTCFYNWPEQIVGSKGLPFPFNSVCTYLCTVDVLMYIKYLEYKIVNALHLVFFLVYLEPEATGCGLRPCQPLPAPLPTCINICVKQF